jgi:hypothetical protein
METTDPEGRLRLWVAALNKGSQPRQIPNVEGSQPTFGPGGEVFFRAREGNSEFLYRVRQDGTGTRKALEGPIFFLWGISPDRRWISAWAPLPGNGLPVLQAFPLDTGTPVNVGSALYRLLWSLDGRFCFIGGKIGEGRTYAIPLAPGQMLPRTPPGGVHSEEELAHLPGALRIDAQEPVPGPSADVYAFYRGTVRRNLYRIPIPQISRPHADKNRAAFCGPAEGRRQRVGSGPIAARLGADGGQAGGGAWTCTQAP